MKFRFGNWRENFWSWDSPHIYQEELFSVKLAITASCVVLVLWLQHFGKSVMHLEGLDEAHTLFQAKWQHVFLVFLTVSVNSDCNFYH
jgi:hypothetical protein